MDRMCGMGMTGWCDHIESGVGEIAGMCHGHDA